MSSSAEIKCSQLAVKIKHLFHYLFKGKFAFNKNEVNYIFTTRNFVEKEGTLDEVISGEKEKESKKDEDDDSYNQ